MARFRRSRQHHVRPVTELDDEGPEGPSGLVAHGLAEAARLGLRVPPAVALNDTAFQHAVRQLLPGGYDPGSLLRVIHRPRGVEQAARAFERLERLQLDSLLESQMAALIDGLDDGAPVRLVVAASPRLDGYDLCRAAGLLGELTMMDPDEEQLFAGVRRLWSRAVREGTLTYLRARRCKDVSMAVVVRRAKGARVRGHLFCRASVGGAETSPTVVSVRGFGSGASEPGLGEVVRFDDRGVVLSRMPASYGALAVSEAKGTAIVDERLLAMLLRMSRVLRSEGDFHVEFESDGAGELEVIGLYRVAPRMLGSAGATRWSRLVVADTGAAPMTALSRSVLSDLASQRFRRALALRRASTNRGAPLGAVHGRTYANVSLLLAPSDHREPFDIATLMEFAGAQVDRAALATSLPSRTLAGMGLRTARLGAELRRLGDSVDRFDREAEQRRRWLSELDLGILPDDALQTTLREGREFVAITSGLLLDVMTVLATTYSMMVSVLARRRDREPRTTAIRIAAGIGDLETAKLGIAFGHVVEIARREPKVVARLLDGAFDDWQALPESATRRAFARLLEAFGDRCPDDLELITPRWLEEPRYLLQALRAGVRADWAAPDAMLSRARASADEEAALVETRLSFVENRLLGDLRLRLRETVRLSARLRVRLAHAAAMLRTILRDVDRRLRRLDPTLERGAAFHCTFDELVAAVGRDRDDLEPLVHARMSEWYDDRREEEPPATFAGTPSPLGAIPAESASFTGFGASAGTAQGRVRLVDAVGGGLEGFVPGDVLLVPMLNAGHAPLIQLSGAIVTELGGYWSDGVVVARELGVPTIVGVQSASKYLVPGELVRVDADQGVVERLDP